MHVGVGGIFERLAGLAGLGAVYCDDYGNCYDDSTGAYSVGTSAPPDIVPVTVPATIPSTSPVAVPGQLPAQAQQQAGIVALSQLTSAALSNIAKLPGQGGLQPGQTLTMGPGGTYQITAAGVQPGATLGVAGLNPTTLLLIAAAVMLMMESGGRH